MNLAKLFPSDLQSLSLFRILLGLVLLADFIINLAPILPDFYYDSGFTPRHLVMASETRAGYISLLSASGHPWVVNAFCALYLAALGCFIIGYRTQLAKWLVFIGYISLIYRTPILDSGAEMLIRLFLLWSLFVPMHRYWSVDAALSRQPREAPVPAIFMASIKLQITWLYLFSGIFKVFGKSWQGGYAISWALSDTFYGGVIGGHFGEMFGFLLPYLNYAIIAFQLSFSALVYSPFFNTPLRLLAIAGAFAMHTAFLILLEVGMFPFLCMVYLVLLIPDRWWNHLFQARRARLANITLYFDPECGFCEKVCRLLREFCLCAATPVRPASDDPEALQLLRTYNSWVVKDGNTGRTYMKWEAVAFVLCQTPLFWPLGALYRLPFLQKPLTALYDCIGRNRPALSKCTAACLPFNDTPYQPTALAKVICAVLIVMAFFSNVVHLPSFANSGILTKVVRDSITLSQTYQKWNLFAPEPTHSAHNYEFTGTTKDGATVDLRPFFEKDRMWMKEGGRYVFQSHRWLKYFSRLYEKPNRRLLRFMLTRFAEKYNAQLQDEAQKITAIRIILRAAPTSVVKAGKPLSDIVDEEINLTQTEAAARP